MSRKLKVGLIVSSGGEAPAWYVHTITEVMKDNGCDLTYITMNLAPASPRGPFFFRLFNRFEHWWFRRTPDAAALKPLPPGPATLSLDTASFLLTGDKLDLLRQHRFDVLYTIHFDGRQPENLSAAAAFGLWFIVFGYGRFRHSAVPAFYEVMRRSPVTGSCLLAWKNGAEAALYEGTTTTVPFSVKNNFNSIAWKSASYLVFRLRELASAGSAFFAAHPPADPAPRRPFALPEDTRMAALFIKNLAGYLSYKIRSRFEGRYTLLYAFAPFHPQKLAEMRFTSLPLPKGRFLADPFLVEKEGVHYLFFEEYDDQASRAHISVMELGAGGPVTPARPVLQKPYHLSYPFVFLHEGTYYMIPETASNRTVELYRAVDFPYTWEHVSNLMTDVELVDVTLHFEDRKWWLFACAANHPSVSTNDQLFLYYSNDLFSPAWTPHPCSPIATHAANCRPAGRIFRHDGRLCRPAQNNASPQYGFGLVINEITTLTENAYSEKPLASLAASSLNLKACHHLDFTSSVVVIDGIRR